MTQPAALLIDPTGALHRLPPARCRALLRQPRWSFAAALPGGLSLYTDQDPSFNPVATVVAAADAAIDTWVHGRALIVDRDGEGALEVVTQIAQATASQPHVLAYLTAQKQHSAQRPSRLRRSAAGKSPLACQVGMR